MLVPLIRSRLIDSLEGMPTVCSVLIASLDTGDPLWDVAFSAERFTLREVFAHLADYDAVWNEYLDKAIAVPSGYAAPVPIYTPDAVAEGRHYDQSDPKERRAALREGRATLVAKLRALNDDDWTAHAITSPRHGHLNIDELAALFVAHDGYHTRQIAEYVSTPPADYCQKSA